MARPKSKHVAEFGDFQTPSDLARQVCEMLRERFPCPAAIVEPNCGHGAFLVAAADTFPECPTFLGQDIHPNYVRIARSVLGDRPGITIQQGDFFTTDWTATLDQLPQPILMIGNPPWVTNAQLGSLDSRNLPDKTNFQQHTGLDALTGKSNFDISEWMLLRLLQALAGKHAVLAMLCKASVARKVLVHAWRHGWPLKSAACHRIDAAAHFQVAVEACLLVGQLAPAAASSEDCTCFPTLAQNGDSQRMGFRDGCLVSDVDAYTLHRNLGRAPTAYRWRSGIKHDCGRVMELTRVGERYRNGLGEVVDLEPRYLFPLRKSSQLASSARPVTDRPVTDRWMLVPQRSIGEDTSRIAMTAPKTWAYLVRHAERLDRRRSSIYRNRPRFSVFGIGEYAFAPWKVAISGFYKRLDFCIVGRSHRKPTVLDDTAYFLPCRTRAEAVLLAELLHTQSAQEFLRSLIFWDAKRPITAAILQRLDLLTLAAEHSRDLLPHAQSNPYCSAFPPA
jgi:hypothetical protein